MKCHKIFFLPLFILLIFYTETIAGVTPAELEIGSEEVIIGTRVVPPFVIKEADGSYSGLTVELLEHITAELEIPFRLEETTIEGMLDGVSNEEFFASASALTITSEREEQVDFTHPFFITGLGIAVPYQATGLFEAFLAIFSPDFLYVVFLLLMLLLFWGLLVWLFERKKNSDEFGGSPAEGIGSGFWWAAVTMTTVGYGDKSPRSFGGRVIGFVWMFTAIILISFFTASIASSLTVNQLESRVNGPEDLPFVRVGVLENAAAVSVLQDMGIRVSAYPTISEGLKAVQDKNIDAFVHDAPIIQYYTSQNFKNAVRVLPNTFNFQYYGIALARNSPDRNEINQIILEYISSDQWRTIQKKYLGN